MRASIAALVAIQLLALLPCPAPAQTAPTLSPHDRKSRSLLRSSGSQSPEILKSLLEQGADIEYTNEYGARPLMYAASNTDPHVIEMLVQEGAKIDARDKLGRTALFYAAEEGNAAAVTALIQQGAKVDARDNTGRTALFSAVIAEHNRLAVTNTLLAARPDVNLSDRYGDTSLKLTLLAHDTAITTVLKEHGARDPLIEAVLQGSAATLRARLANTKPLAPPAVYSALETAIRIDRPDLLPLLLAHHADPNARNRDGRPLLLQVAARGDLPALKTLLVHGADIRARDSEGNTVLMSLGSSGSEKDYERIFRFLQSRGADINAQDRYGWTLVMHTSAGIIPTPTLHFLLEHGADPRIPDKNGNTALIRLAWWTQYDLIMGGQEEDHAQAITLLAQHGVDVNAHNKDGMTALMYAAGWSHPPALKALLAAGAQVDQRDSRGRTALTWAARHPRGSKEVQLLRQAGARFGPTEALLLDDLPLTEALLASGSDASVPDGYNATLLMIAAEKGQSALVEKLLARGSDVNARDRDGMSALMLAIAGRSHSAIPSARIVWDAPAPSDAKTRIVQMLLDHHADPNLQANLRQNALKIAQDVKNTPLADLLTRYGAKLPPPP